MPWCLMSIPWLQQLKWISVVFWNEIIEFSFTYLIDDPNVTFVAGEADEAVHNVDFGSNDTAD